MGYQNIDRLIDEAARLDGLQIGATSTDTIGFLGATPVAQQAAFTAAETTITFVEPTTADYAIQSATTSTPAGFATANEANTFIGVVENLQVRVAEIETVLETFGFVAA